MPWDHTHYRAYRHTLADSQSSGNCRWSSLLAALAEAAVALARLLADPVLQAAMVSLLAAFLAALLLRYLAG
jgi:hypothetical protein